MSPKLNLNSESSIVVVDDQFFLREGNCFLPFEIFTKDQLEELNNELNIILSNVRVLTDPPMSDKTRKILCKAVDLITKIIEKRKTGQPTTQASGVRVNKPLVVFKDDQYQIHSEGQFRPLDALTDDHLALFKQRLSELVEETPNPTQLRFHYKGCVGAVNTIIRQRQTTQEKSGLGVKVDPTTSGAVGNHAPGCIHVGEALAQNEKEQKSEILWPTTIMDPTPTDLHSGWYTIPRHNNYSFHPEAPGIVRGHKKDGRRSHHDVFTSGKKGAKKAYKFMYDMVACNLDMNDPELDAIYELYANFIMRSEALRVRSFDGQLLARPTSDEGWVDAVRPSSKSRKIELSNLSEKRREIVLKIFRTLSE